MASLSIGRVYQQLVLETLEGKDIAQAIKMSFHRLLVMKFQIDWQIVVKFSELVKGMEEDQPIFHG